MAGFNLEQVRHQPERNRRDLARTAIPGKGAGEPFLRGPIPLGWLSVAANLPGKALHVSMAIWHRASLEQNGTVSLGNNLLDSFGVKPDAKRRALLALEGASLISIERRENRNPIVTLLPYPPDDNEVA